jgi:AcrR family transcriptional regulator
MELTRKERERQAHRRAMLDAAERVFVRKGYYQATVEEIAQEAEFSVGTLYNFFKNKEDLYGQVVEKIAREFLADFEAHVLTRADPEEAVGALIELRLTHFEEHRGFFRVFFETSPGSRLDPARALPESCVGLYDHYVEQVAELFRRAVDAGRFAPFDPFYLTLCLEGIINAFVAYWSRREPVEPLPARVAKMKASFIERLKVRLPEVEAGPAGHD